MDLIDVGRTTTGIHSCVQTFIVMEFYSLGLKTGKSQIRRGQTSLLGVQLSGVARTGGQAGTLPSPCINFGGGIDLREMREPCAFPLLNPALHSDSTTVHQCSLRIKIDATCYHASEMRVGCYNSDKSLPKSVGWACPQHIARSNRWQAHLRSTRRRPSSATSLCNYFFDGTPLFRGNEWKGLVPGHNNVGTQKLAG